MNKETRVETRTTSRAGRREQQARTKTKTAGVKNRGGLGGAETPGGGRLPWAESAPRYTTIAIVVRDEMIVQHLSAPRALCQPFCCSELWRQRCASRERGFGSLASRFNSLRTHYFLQAPCFASDISVAHDAMALP